MYSLVTYHIRLQDPNAIDAQAGKVNNRVRKLVRERIQLAEAGEWNQLAKDLLARIPSNSSAA